jgi:hypothetical protein
MTTPIGKEWLVSKSYRNPDGTLSIEGWVSTPKQDIEKDILEPEGFSGEGFYGYMSRGAPVSTEHDTNSWPIGYIQKATLVRAGKILQEEVNPKVEKGEYRYFDRSMIGWYARGVIDDDKAIEYIGKGKLGAFSWIGMPRVWEDLKGGGRRFSQKGAINPLLEVTVTAYPINVDAVMRIAKAHGYQPEPKAYKLDVQAVVDAYISMRSASMREAVESAFAKEQK